MNENKMNAANGKKADIANTADQSETKKVFRLFTIADWKKEEEWLRKMSLQGWKLLKVNGFDVYTFEKAEAEDVIYRLDLPEKDNDPDFLQMCQDFGWEYVGRYAGWTYFRRPAASASAKEDTELFSDEASKLGMVSRLFCYRVVPLLMLMTVIQTDSLRDDIEAGLGFRSVGAVALLVLDMLAVGLVVYCVVRLFMIRRKIRRGED